MDYYNVKLSRRLRRMFIITVSVIITAVILGVILNVYSGYLEAKELGDEFVSVFVTNLEVKVIAQVISFLTVFLIFYINTVIIKKVMISKGSPIVGMIDKTIPKIIISIVLAIIASAFITDSIYDRYLLCINQVDFGLVDPLFGKDIGYYVFLRPFISSLIESILSVWICAIVYSIAFYAVIYTVNGLLHVSKMVYDKPIIIHNVVNVSIFFILKAITYKFKSEEVLYSSIGDLAGAGFTEINVWYNFYRVIPFFLIAIVIVALILLLRGKYKSTIVTVALYPVSIIVVSLVAVVVQNFIVSPNEVIKERPYITWNMEYTSLAYNINNINKVGFAANNNLTTKDLDKNADIINNIRITDFSSTLTAANELQGIRNYYSFRDVDIEKYNINGKPTLAWVSAREFNKDNLDDTTASYVNRVFRFTHGFGAVMASVNQTTEQGQPKFLIKDIPPISDEGVVEITQPRIYYGEGYEDYAIVNSTIKEIDYSEGSVDKEFSYDGNGGIKLGFLNRLIYSIKNADFKMLISQYVTDKSKILINRDVRRRVESAVPFLMVDDDPYLVIDDSGKLKWIVDCYTTSSYYPYSQSYNGINYIRNSVKAVVDAYDGDVKLYVIDKVDPIIKSYMKIYPRIFAKSELPVDLREHIVYPEMLFKLQAQVYGKYHVTNPNTFFNKSDVWVFGKEKHGSETKSILPYYNLSSVKGLNNGLEMIVMLPYTLSNKENMVSWIAASCDYNNYGKLVVYEFPKGKNVYGTLQVESRIDNDPSIAKEMTLWSQGGTNVIRGNMMVVPIENSLLYIEPIYITSDNSAAIPELKRVAVAYDDKIVMEPTLEQALKVLFKGGQPTGPVGTLEDNEPSDNNGDTGNENITNGIGLDEVIDRVLNHYYDAQNDSARGDWSGFGDKMQKLDEAIRELEKFKTTQ